MLPVLFFTPETRRKLLLPLAIYALVSLSFLLVDGLNPGGYNAIHWLNIARASSSPVQVLWLTSPIEYDMLGDFRLYSLPVLLDCAGRPHRSDGALQASPGRDFCDEPFPAPCAAGSSVFGSRS